MELGKTNMLLSQESTVYLHATANQGDPTATRIDHPDAL
jgi:hypothetical protein